MDKIYVTKEKLNKQLCIHCKYIVPVSTSEKYLCGLVLSKVDDSPVYTAKEARSWAGCLGQKWEINPNITACSSEAEAEILYEEDQINKYMDQARAIVKNKYDICITNGYLNKAIERARNEVK